MARYRYAGPGPQEDPGGGIARPGDVREFAEEPGWGPWEPVEDDVAGGPESPGEPPAVPAPAAPARSAAAATPVLPKGFGTESAPEGG